MCARSWSPADTQEGIATILNALPAMVGYWDRDLRNRLANDAYVEYFGRSPEEMRGIDVRELLGAELFEQNRPFIERALAGEPQLFDREIRTPTGELRYVQASYVPDVGGGRGARILVLVTDITARHRMELALHASEERYRTLIKNLPLSAVTVVGPDLRLRWVGGGVPSAAGLEVESMLGRPVRETSGGGEHGLLIEGLYGRALSGEDVSAEVHGGHRTRLQRPDRAVARARRDGRRGAGHRPGHHRPQACRAGAGRRAAPADRGRDGRADGQLGVGRRRRPGPLVGRAAGHPRHGPGARSTRVRAARGLASTPTTATAWPLR